MPKSSTSTAVTTGDTILIVLWVLAAFGILAGDGTQLFERAAARNNTISCMELADPTVGNYSGSEELELFEPRRSARFSLLRVHRCHGNAAR
jgi:hypothetical protein